MGRWLGPGLVALLCLSAGCFQARYLTQAAGGQLALRRAAEPIDQVLADEKTPPRVRALLSEVSAIKAFGERRGLKATKNYRDYADVKRPAVAWAVSACEPLRFEEKLWRFPLVGSVPYLGFFREKTARRYARELEREGWDVDVRGVTTYSTLGWFRDPITSTMLREGDAALGDLADVVLHESVHATIYLDDQTTFNESLASFVAPRLAAEWLASRSEAEPSDESGARQGPPEARAFEAARERAARVDRVLHDAWVELDALYRSAVDDGEKLARKAEVLARVEGEVGFAVNNATLTGARTYGAGEPELAALFEACGRDWERFWGAIRLLDEDDFPSKQMEDLTGVLGPLAERGCGPAPGAVSASR